MRGCSSYLSPGLSERFIVGVRFTETNNFLTLNSQMSMQTINDRLLLIGTGLGCAALSLLFFRVTKENGLVIMGTITHIALWLENSRLSKRVKRLEQQLKTKSAD